MFPMLNRMCWNSRGWRLPTNTSIDGGYPREMGFGHEEWNFQIEDAVEGFVYGYLYYKPASRIIEVASGHFRIIFWSMHPESRSQLVVGSYDDATLPSDDDYHKAYDVFMQKGIFGRRANELCVAVPSMSKDRALREVTKAISEKWLNFKCRVENVHVLPYYLPLKQVIPNKAV